MRRIAIMLMIIVLIGAATVSAFGYSVLENGTTGASQAVCTNSGLYRIGFSGTVLHIERITPRPFSEEVSLPYPIASTALYGDYAVALCDSTAENEIVVYSYEIGTGVMESYPVPYSYGYHRGFYFDGSMILIQDDDRPSVVRQFSRGGSLRNTYDFQGADITFIPGYNGGLYILCDGRLYRCSGSSYQLIEGPTLNAPISYISDNTVADSHGALYRISGNRIQTILQSGINSGYPAAALMNGCICIADGCTVYRFDDMSGRRTDYFTADYPIALLYGTGDTLYALSDSETAAVMRIESSDFIPCPDEQTLPDTPSQITSSVYRIDSAGYRITRIPSPTTFAQLKANIRYNGYEAALYRGGKNVKTGNVGTAMTVVFSGVDTRTYELSVIGDITGEGNVNSRDVGELMDYFLGNLSFDGVYADAADLSDDGRVDMLDLALLCRLAN